MKHRFQVRPDVRDRVISTKGRHCTYCGRGPLYKKHLHLDHVDPVAAGGRSDADNLVPACKACNARKGRKPLRLYIDDRLVELERERAILMALRSVFDDW